MPSGPRPSVRVESKSLMLNQENLTSVVDAYEASTRKAIEHARKLEIPAPVSITFQTDKLSALTIDALVNEAPKLPRGEGKLRKRGFVYLFALGDECDVESHAITSAMRTSKAAGRDADDGKLPAINDKHDGRVLYVGRSWNVMSRIREHLKADCSKKTYALRFAAWANELNLEVELLIWEFPGIADLTLQVVEDGLWDRLGPLFGRRGAK